MRFRTKVFLVFMAFACLVTALMSAFTFQSKELLEKQAEENQRNIARVIHLSAQRLLSENVSDLQVLTRITEEIKEIEAVSEVTIIDRNQNVVASTNRELVGQYHPLSSMELAISRKLGKKEETEEYGSFEIGVPVMRNQQMIGLVRTTMALKDIRRPLQLLYVKNILIILGILAAGFWVSVFLLNRLNRPLSQLIAAVEKISAGDLSAAVPSTSRDEFGQLAESFNRATQKLSEQKQLEDRVHQLERRAIVAELSSCLAHEIRNPLNLIMLTANHLGNQFSPHDQTQRQQYKEYIASLKAEVKHLNQMVSNFLSMGKSSTVMRTKFKMSPVIERIGTLVKQQLIAKKINLDIAGETELELFADEEQMQLVFLNLILNAIAVVPFNGHIQVKAGRNPDHAGHVLLSVTDNGPGIKPENIDIIFEPYFTEKPDGIGLGLALVKRIVEDHDGWISAGNRAGGGARFDLSLPLEEV